MSRALVRLMGVDPPDGQVADLVADALTAASPGGPTARAKYKIEPRVAEASRGRCSKLQAAHPLYPGNPTLSEDLPGRWARIGVMEAPDPTPRGHYVVVWDPTRPWQVRATDLSMTTDYGNHGGADEGGPRPAGQGKSRGCHGRRHLLSARAFNERSWASVRRCDKRDREHPRIRLQQHGRQTSEDDRRCTRTVQTHRGARVPRYRPRGAETTRGSPLAGYVMEAGVVGALAVLVACRVASETLEQQVRRAMATATDRSDN